MGGQWRGMAGEEVSSAQFTKVYSRGKLFGLPAEGSGWENID